jgi:hypothetical protein
MATRIWTEVAMNRIHYLRRIGRFAAALAGLAAARAAFGATPAFAVRHPEPGPPNPVPAARRSRSTPSSPVACPAGSPP